MEIDRTTEEYKREFRSQGQYLFRVIKANDINEIINVINKNVDLVSYKDDFDQIPLHICSSFRFSQRCSPICPDIRLHNFLHPLDLSNKLHI